MRHTQNVQGVTTPQKFNLFYRSVGIYGIDSELVRRPVSFSFPFLKIIKCCVKKSKLRDPGIPSRLASYILEKESANQINFLPKFFCFVTMATRKDLVCQRYIFEREPLKRHKSHGRANQSKVHWVRTCSLWIN